MDKQRDIEILVENVSVAPSITIANLNFALNNNEHNFNLKCLIQLLVMAWSSFETSIT